MTAPLEFAALASALAANRRLCTMRADTTCVRLVAGAADGCDGLFVDRFGSVLVATSYAPLGAADVAQVTAACRDAFPECHLIVKSRAAGHGEGENGGAPFTVQRFVPPGWAAPAIATELGLRFEIGTDPAHDFGLYLDAAKARAYVRGVARGRNVLNLFSYAGAFGVAAAVGGATSITNVDASRDYNGWALRNAALNGISFRALLDTAQAFLRRHLRRMGRTPAPSPFDLVVADPPAFGVGRGKERILRLFWPELFAALRTMKPAHLVLLCNDKAFRQGRSFPELVAAELGALYAFERLGTCLLAEDLTAATPNLAYTPRREDGHYLEPVVLAGRLKAESIPTDPASGR